MIRSELRALAGSRARGTPAAVSYNDDVTEGSPDALSPQVRYHMDGGQMLVTINLLQGERDLAETTIRAAAADPEATAKQVAAAIVNLAEKRRPDRLLQ